MNLENTIEKKNSLVFVINKTKYKFAFQNLNK